MNLGSLYNMFGNFETADKYFAKAVSLAPTRHDVYWAWAENTHIRQDYEQAISIYKKAILLDREVAVPYYELSLYLQRIGQTEEAEKLFQLALSKGLQERHFKKHGNYLKQNNTTSDENQTSSEEETSP